MTRLTCDPLLLEACRGLCPGEYSGPLADSTVSPCVAIRLPVLGAPGKRPLSRLSADTMLADLHRLGWRFGLPDAP